MQGLSDSAESVRGPMARSCDGCTLCCRLPDIEALSKPANSWCVHCVSQDFAGGRTGGGCRIYADRPQLCRDFLCLWRIDASLGAEWDPLVSHMMIYRQGPQMTVLVDPDHAEIWRQAPYLPQLEDWARDHEESGGYIIVFAGEAVFKVDPSPPARD